MTGPVASVRLAEHVEVVTDDPVTVNLMYYLIRSRVPDTAARTLRPSAVPPMPAAA